MFHDMCAPSSRITFKAEIRKLIIKHLKVSNVCSTFFPNRVIKQLFFKKLFYDGKQPLSASMLQVVLQIEQGSESISTQF